MRPLTAMRATDSEDSCRTEWRAQHAEEPKPDLHQNPGSSNRHHTPEALQPEIRRGAGQSAPVPMSVLFASRHFSKQVIGSQLQVDDPSTPHNLEIVSIVCEREENSLGNLRALHCICSAHENVDIAGRAKQMSPTERQGVFPFLRVTILTLLLHAPIAQFGHTPASISALPVRARSTAPPAIRMGSCLRKKSSLSRISKGSQLTLSKDARKLFLKLRKSATVVGRLA